MYGRYYPSQLPTSRLVVEDSPEMLLVREDICLVWKVRTARVHEIDARKSYRLSQPLRQSARFFGGAD